MSYLSSKHFDAENIQGLTPDIFRSHVNNALHAELGTNGGSGNTVLSRTSLCDDSCFPYTTGK
jgi:hypothetical protein